MSVTADDIRDRLSTDFEFYAEHCLKISTKKGELQPFLMNKAQKHILSRIEKQMQERGYARIILLKSRQIGGSTFTGGYFYRNTTLRNNVNTFILSHATDTTDALFEMTRRFHDNCPNELRPRTDAISFKRIKFSDLDSSYAIGTAGAKNVGRGRTIHNFHGSEVAFWPDAEEHFNGVMQAVPSGNLAEGTCVILESTANGQTGKFYELCMDAISGDNEYELVFVPWFWQDEYTSPAPDDYEVPTEDLKYMEDHSLTRDQMWWAHTKRRSLGADWRFKQEYPATVMEAFQTSGDESYISPELIAECRIQKGNAIIEDDSMPRIGACDPAGTGDRIGFCWRQGKRVFDVTYKNNMDTQVIAQECVNYINANRLHALFVDVIGIGAGVYDRLKHMGWGHIAKPVNVSGSAVDLNADGTPKYLNKRAEVWGRMREDMEAGPYEIPNLDELAADLMAPQYHYNNSRGVLQLESKKDMRKRGVSSPDGGDAIAMTYSEPVNISMLHGIGESVKIVTEYDVLNF